MTIDRDEMKEIMLLAFKKSSLDHYISKGWIIPDDFSSFSNGVKQIHKDSGVSFNYKNIMVSVDFALGTGCKAGSPTDTKYITVFYGEEEKYLYEKFTFNEFIKIVWERENGLIESKQLSLF